MTRGRENMMLVGRSAEVGRLEAALRSADESGRGSVVSVVGPAGVGRSTLLDAMEAMAATQGLAVRSVRADRLAQGLPLSVASELMGVDAPVSLVSDAAVHRGFDAAPLSQAATAEILQAVEQAAEQPTVLVVNDLQWADRWSLLVLGRIAQITLDRPLVLVLGVLSTASSQRPEVGELLSIDQEVTRLRIDLGPLDRTATVELARRRLGDEPGPVLRRMIERSGGSPLLVIELLAAVENRMVRADGRVDVSSESFPSEVAGVVELRLAGLSPSQRTTLSRAAALGRKFSVDDLAAVSASSVLELAPDLTELCRGGLLAERGDGFSFVHELVREAIYAENPASIRQAMHRDIASVLEAAGAPAFVVAHHLAEGAEPGDAHTVDLLIEAAAQLEATDSVMALSLLSRASEINDREETRNRIDLARAAPLAWTGQLDEASELMVRAIDTHRDPEARAELRWIRMGMLILANRASEAVDEASRAAAETRDPVTEARIVSEEALARLASLDPETVSTAHRAIALGESCGDATAIGSALSALSRTSSSRHGYVEGAQQTRRAVDLAENDPTREAHRMTPWFHHGVMLLDLEDGAGVADSIRHGRARMQDLGNYWADPFYCGLAASLAFREGRLDEATAEALGGIAVGGDTGNVAPLGWCHAIEAHIALYQGDLDRATDHVDRAKHLRREGLATFGGDFVSRADALLQEARGDVDRALTVLRDTWHGYAAFEYFNCQPLLGPDLVRMATAAGDSSTVDDVLQQLEANVVPDAPSSFAAIQLRSRGLARRDPALLETAVDAYPPGRGLDRALTELEWAECLAATGNHAEAGRVAAGLQPTLLRWDATALQARLAAIGSQEVPVARIDDPWDRLTPAELEVVTMLAGGLTNAEIARERGTSSRTVESQIHRTYQKIGVSSRTRLAVEAAQRLG